MFGPARFRFVAIGLAAGILAGEVTVPASAATEAPMRMVYRVQHSKYGDVGSYTNTIEKDADITSVNTQGRIKVSVLGIPAYSQAFDRVERWQGSRLVNFHGVTTDNGKRIEVTGAAEGDHFTLTTPTGTIGAPANVKLANPWSDALLSADTIVTPEEGGVEKVSVSDGESAPITINGHSIDTRHYRIQRQGGPKRFEVWLDGEGIPVRFADVSPSETLTFNLSECEGAAVCPLLIQQALATAGRHN
jgi:hypothetical protein